MVVRDLKTKKLMDRVQRVPIFCLNTHPATCRLTAAMLARSPE